MNIVPELTDVVPHQIGSRTIAPTWQTSSYSSGTGDLDSTCVQVAAVLP
jgi:hypothetical protein